MKRSFLSLFACLAIAAIASPIAMAQGQAEISVRTSLTRFEPRVEAAAALATFENVFRSKLKAGFYASAGSSIGTDNRPTGAFALLIQTPPDWIARGVRIDLGPGLLIERDKGDTTRFRSRLDLEGQIVVKGPGGSSLTFAAMPKGGAGGFGIFFTKRY